MKSHSNIVIEYLNKSQPSTARLARAADLRAAWWAGPGCHGFEPVQLEQRTAAETKLRWALCAAESWGAAAAAADDDDDDDDVSI